MAMMAGLSMPSVGSRRTSVNTQRRMADGGQHRRPQHQLAVGRITEVKPLHALARQLLAGLINTTQNSFLKVGCCLRQTAGQSQGRDASTQLETAHSADVTDTRKAAVLPTLQVCRHTFTKTASQSLDKDESRPLGLTTGCNCRPRFSGFVSSLIGKGQRQTQHQQPL